MLRLSWLTIIRQPARTALAILGVAAVGALLFDMLLLSRGLVLSFRDLLDRAGFDVRVLATRRAAVHRAAHSRRDRRLTQPSAGCRRSRRCCSCACGTADCRRQPCARRRRQPTRTDGNRSVGARRVEFIGVDPRVRPMWTLVEGRDLPRALAAARRQS